MTRRTCFLAVLCALLVTQSVYADNFTTAEGGNVTRLDIIRPNNQTRHWQGFAGQVFFGTNVSLLNQLNATGGLVNASNLFFEIDCNNPDSATGFIFLSNGTTTPANLTAGNLTILDALLGNGDDDGSATFMSTSSFALSTGTITDVPTVFSFVNETFQSSAFREGYLNQGNDFVFVVAVEEDLHGYNTSFFDYQALVPAVNQSTVQYSVFGDITFTCPGVAVGAGGGGGAKRRYTPIKIIRPTEQPPRLERVEQLPEPELQGFLKRLELRLEPAGTNILDKAEINGVLINHNDLFIPDVNFVVDAPQLLIAPAIARPYPLLFWDTGLFGLQDHGVVEPKALTTSISGLPVFPLIAPRSETYFSFDAVPPIMQPRVLDLGVHVFAGPVRIAAGFAPLSVEAPKFGVYDVPVRESVRAFYFVVDNRNNEEKSINIEFALNRKRTALVADVLGPLTVPADSVAVFAHEYRLSRTAMTADSISARLYSKKGEISANSMR